MVSVVAKGLRYRGVNSAVRVAAFGKAPPIPNPAQKRSSSNIVSECADAIPSVDSPKIATLRINAARRQDDPQQASADTSKRHSEQTRREHRRKAALGDAPLLGDGRDRKAEQLNIQAIEDNGKRGQGNHRLLPHGPRTEVEQLCQAYRFRGAKVVRCHTARFRPQHTHIVGLDRRYFLRRGRDTPIRPALPAVLFVPLQHTSLSGRV